MVVSASTSITFATYNILDPFLAVKWLEPEGLNSKGKESLDDAKMSTMTIDPNSWKQYSNWAERCPIISKNIQLASIVCLQETSKESIKQLLQITPGYQLAISVFHSYNNQIQEYGNSIVFKDGEAKLIKAFELKHPFEMTYSFREGSRSAACGIFQITDKVIKVVSVHLSGYNPTESDFKKKQKSKENGYTELATYVYEAEKDLTGIDGVVICGDFNEGAAEAKAPLYRLGYLQNRSYFSDNNPAITHPKTERRIDWLFFKHLDSKSVATIAPMGIEAMATRASDHLITGTKLEYFKKSEPVPTSTSATSAACNSLNPFHAVKRTESTSATFAVCNSLNPFHAVKRTEPAALNTEGLQKLATHPTESLTCVSTLTPMGIAATTATRESDNLITSTKLEKQSELVSTSTSATFAAYNILNPFHAIKWAEPAGLNDQGIKMQTTNPTKLRTADFNCWIQYSNWSERRIKISQNIQLASIVCLQQASEESIQELLQITPGYKLAMSVFHSRSLFIQDQGNSIVYKEEQAKLLETFEIKHSIGTGFRSAACGVFQIADKIIKVVSVNLFAYNATESDVVKKQANKQHGFNELKTYVDAVEKDLSGIHGIIICGDFNEDTTEKEAPLYRLGYLLGRGYFFDGNSAITYPSTKRRLDWLFFKSLDFKSRATLTPMGIEATAIVASDHLITGTKIEWDPNYTE
jgi:endonuclease/exonuclease/phosphatase family metal-dependent hydrolase